VGLKFWNCPRLYFLNLCLVSRMFTPHSYSQPLDQPSQSLQTRLTNHPTATVSALSQLTVVFSHVQIPLATRLDLLTWREDRLWPQHQDTRDLDRATRRQRLTLLCHHQQLVSRTFHRHLPTQWSLTPS